MLIPCILLSLAVGACTPWYTLYGIPTKDALYDPASVHKVARALEDRNPSTRIFALVALGRMGAGAREAVPAVARLLEDANLNVRQHAAETLLLIGEADEALPDLGKALDDPNAEVRLFAVKTLHGIGRRHAEVVPILVKAIKDFHVNVRLATLHAILDLEPERADGFPALKTLLGDGNPAVRKGAVLALQGTRFPQPVFLPFLDHMANDDPHEKVREAAVSVLGEAAGEPYRSARERPRGYARVDISFTKEKIPIAIGLRRVVDGIWLPATWDIGEAFPLAPGEHTIGLRMADFPEAKDLASAVARVEEGKTTLVELSVTHQRTEPVPGGIRYSFDHAVTVKPPASLKP